MTSFQPNLQFTFREARSSAEQLALFQLRYEVYQACPLAKALTKLNRDLSDDWDQRSRHFGLYITDDICGDRPVGNVRLTPYLTSNGETPDLPILHYSPELAQVWETVSSWSSEGFQVAEAGKLALHPDLQTSGLARSMVICAAAAAFLVAGYDRVAIGTYASLKRLYAPVGFQPMSGTQPRFYERLGIKGCSLWTSLENIPYPFSEEVLLAGDLLRHNGFISLSESAKIMCVDAIVESSIA